VGGVVLFVGGVCVRARVVYVCVWCVIARVKRVLLVCGVRVCVVCVRVCMGLKIVL
jgi:hypothetical protein